MSLIQVIIYLLGIITYGSTQLGEWVGQVLMYLFATIDSGDPLNDWRTHILDPHVREVAEFIGYYLVNALGL